MTNNAMGKKDIFRWNRVIAKEHFDQWHAENNSNKKEGQDATPNERDENLLPKERSQ